MMDELKPCPFCGSKAELKRWWTGLGISRYTNRVQCTNKKCRCNSGDWKIKPKAIAAWNRRYVSDEDDGK